MDAVDADRFWLIVRRADKAQLNRLFLAAAKTHELIFSHANPDGSLKFYLFKRSSDSAPAH
jgi:hypothetical protein